MRSLRRSKDCFANSIISQNLGVNKAVLPENCHTHDVDAYRRAKRDVAL